VMKQIHLAGEMQQQFKAALSAEIEAMQTKAEPAARTAMEILGPSTPMNTYFARSLKALVKGESIKSVPIVHTRPEESATPRLDARRKLLREQLRSVSSAGQMKCADLLKFGTSADSILIKQDRQIRYLIEWENGAPLQIREVEEVV
jgi:hypothetical protein